MRLVLVCLLFLASCSRAEPVYPDSEFVGDEFFPRIERRGKTIVAWAAYDVDAAEKRRLREYVGPGRLIIRDLETDEVIGEVD